MLSLSRGGWYSWQLLGLFCIILLGAIPDSGQGLLLCAQGSFLTRLKGPYDPG